MFFYLLKTKQPSLEVVPTTSTTFSPVTLSLDLWPSSSNMTELNEHIKCQGQRLCHSKVIVRKKRSEYQQKVLTNNSTKVLVLTQWLSSCCVPTVQYNDCWYASLHDGRPFLCGWRHVANTIKNSTPNLACELRFDHICKTVILFHVKTREGPRKTRPAF